MLFKKNRAGGILCLLWLGCFPFIHHVVQFEDRYRTPILWLTFLLAASALMRIGLWIMRRAGFPESSLAPYDRQLQRIGNGRLQALRRPRSC
jgi:hypothetical protein